jgi:hypothetical protein
MQRKAQIFVLKEVLSFAIGFAVVVGVLILFNLFIVPKILDYSSEESLRNLVSHVDFLISRAYRIASQGSLESNFTYRVEMPRVIITFPYRVYISDREICAEFSGYAKKYCSPSSLPSGIELEGYHLSGAKLIIFCRISEEKARVSIYPAYY